MIALKLLVCVILCRSLSLLILLSPRVRFRTVAVMLIYILQQDLNDFNERCTLNCLHFNFAKWSVITLHYDDSVGDKSAVQEAS